MLINKRHSTKTLRKINAGIQYAAGTAVAFMGGLAASTPLTQGHYGDVVMIMIVAAITIALLIGQLSPLNEDVGDPDVMNTYDP